MRDNWWGKLGWLGAALIWVSAGASTVVWPTPDDRWARGEAALESVLQPTVSGRDESALFGCVRNGGRRFHEGLDITTKGRDRRGEATDAIYAIMDGRVTLVNAIAGASSYGRYIVIEHDRADVAVYSLYAHLANIAEGIREGTRVNAGTRIGTMGRSASYSIPPSRAHLHLEIGLRKSDDFQRWFNEQPFGSKNRFGNYNGMNLTGFDPVDFYQTIKEGEFFGFAQYLQKDLETAYTLRVFTTRFPDFVHRYPALLTQTLPDDDLAGWEIDFTWYGLAKQWTPLKHGQVEPRPEGELELVLVYPEAFENGDCRETIELKSNAKGEVIAAEFGDNLKKDLEQIFGFDFG